MRGGLPLGIVLSAKLTNVVEDGQDTNLREEDPAWPSPLAY